MTPVRRSPVDFREKSRRRIVPSHASASPEHRKIGLASVEDVAQFLEGYFRQNDANDLLAMLWTWQHADDISANARFNGDFVAAL
jgi:hypothetical protein